MPARSSLGSVTCAVHAAAGVIDAVEFGQLRVERCLARRQQLAQRAALPPHDVVDEARGLAVHELCQRRRERFDLLGLAHFGQALEVEEAVERARQVRLHGVFIEHPADLGGEPGLAVELAALRRRPQCIVGQRVAQEQRQLRRELVAAEQILPTRVLRAELGQVHERRRLHDGLDHQRDATRMRSLDAAAGLVDREQLVALVLGERPAERARGEAIDERSGALRFGQRSGALDRGAARLRRLGRDRLGHRLQLDGDAARDGRGLGRQKARLAERAGLDLGPAHREQVADGVGEVLIGEPRHASRQHGLARADRRPSAAASGGARVGAVAAALVIVA